jgi:hypothetical protein
MPRTTAPTPQGRGGGPAAEVDLDAAPVVPAPGEAAGARRGPPPRAVASALALALAASVATGVAVHRRDLAVAHAAPPHLEVGYPEVRGVPAVDGSAPRARIVLPVLNASDRPVVVSSVELPERAGPLAMALPGLQVAPGERERVAFEASPRCALPSGEGPDVATLVVRTGDGQAHTLSTELAAPFGRPALSAQLQGLCSAPGLGRPVQMAVSLLDDATLVLRVTNTSRHPAELSLVAPRASGIVSDPALPLEVAEGDEVSIALTAAPECDTWSGGLPSMSVDVVSSSPAASERAAANQGRDAPSGWSGLLTSWLGGQVARACDPGLGAG